MGIYARDIICVHTDTHTHIVWLSHWSIRCGDAKMNWRSSPPPSNFMSHGLSEICAMHGVACVNEWLGRILYLRANWAFLDAKRKCLGECQAQWRGIFLQNCGAPMTHTHIYIYIYIYYGISLYSHFRKITILTFCLAFFLAFGSRRAQQHRYGVEVQLAILIWCSGPGVPRRIRSWRYGA